MYNNIYELPLIKFIVFGLLEIKQNLACTSTVSLGNHSISKVSSSQVGVVLSRLLFRVSNNAIKKSFLLQWAKRVKMLQ